MNENCELTPDMSIKEMIFTMSKGNPGALIALMEVAHSNGFMSILLCNSLNIKGEKFYMLFNDCCDNNMDKYLITIRMFQMEILTEKQIMDNLNMQRAIPFINSNLTFAEFNEKSKEEIHQLLENEKKSYLERLSQFLPSSKQI